MDVGVGWKGGSQEGPGTWKIALGATRFSREEEGKISTGIRPGNLCSNGRERFVKALGTPSLVPLENLTLATSRATMYYQEDFFLHFSLFPRELLGLFEDEKGHLKRRERDEKEVRRVGVSLRKGL